jgi:hypothetical protein
MYHCEAAVSALGESACFAIALARAERERDEARAEAAWLTKINVQLGEVERALEDGLSMTGCTAPFLARAALERLRIAETTRDAAQAIATRETERRREVERRYDSLGFRAHLDADATAREADELRELAWKWCIAAKIWSEDAVIRAEWDEPPIESLGPVPVTELDVVILETSGDRERRLRAWLVRDAVRRGAKIEGDDQ